MSKKQDNATVNRHVVRRLLKYGKPYIGWFLLCTLTCGLLTFMVMPYMLQANTEFYRHLNGESDVQEQEEVIA